MNKAPLNIQEIQSVSLEVLKNISDICENICCRYFLTYGTLIGAVRHQGFIPWDDDVDIMMPRPDYELFLNYFERQNNRIGNLQLFNQKNCKEYPYGISRVCDMDYVINTDNEKDCGMGIFVDIYPLDGLGDYYEESLNMMERSHLICDKILLLTRDKFYCPQLYNFKKQADYIWKKYKYTQKGKCYFYQELKPLIERYNYEDSKYVGCVAWTFEPTKEIYERSLIEHLVKTTFEKYQFYIPQEYDKMLRITYGDYMQLPPEEQRIYHHGYTAYKREV